VAFGVCVRVAILFSLKKERKVRGGNRTRCEAGGQFLFLLSRFSLDSRGGRGWCLKELGCHLCGAVRRESSNVRGQVLEGSLQVGCGWW